MGVYGKASDIRGTSFEVRELHGGQGSFRFDWHIEALRKGMRRIAWSSPLPNPAVPAPPVLPAPLLPPTRPAPGK